MNASFQTCNAHAARPVAAVAPSSRREPRSRDFGIGYGSSSGYSGNAFAPRFRCS